MQFLEQFNTFFSKLFSSHSADLSISVGISSKGMRSKKTSPKTGRPRNTFNRLGYAPNLLNTE